MNDRRDGHVAFGLATAAVAWGLLLVVAALVVPASSSESCRALPAGPTSCTHDTQTFAHGLGIAGLLLLLVPAAVALLAWLLLHAKCSYGLRGAGLLAYLCGYLLLIASVVGVASFGLFLVPIPLLLLAAAARTPYGAQSAPR